ncbi:putative membrane-associated protein, chloroplastic Flags: Precursor [Monoraphidium neglectum]|uniref:Membrane-associated 30 kDa protein n=1 Tax=Monoraphidium neglectum TaxID=145388 RepID=A0A0D2N7F8_9CHLO|nr:putative membrane-associated protein, chloroplastic Flags: Precursor [Monoraphidium neglectum]KIZ01776.1 putative membrane-associated protein, chloroplastic Flags: Precursor [Monoraphidium neglectum]|eukprot:XP_013900795.1 putative membrane-associated protein, chloroplastic Flags: Precursor [Monoraphidium neglectum]
MQLRGARLQASSARGMRAVAPVRPVRAGRRSVVVQANLFSRITRVVKSYAEQIVSSAEDPEKVLDQVVNEMQEDLIKMRQAAAQVMASQKQMEAKYKQAQATADDWLKRAELAVAKGEDELAREALKRRKAFQDNAEGMRIQLEAQQKATDQLIANTKVLEGKLAEAKSKKDTLKARAASAKTSKQVQEMMGSLNTSNAVVAFDKMEEKVIAMEAQSEAVGMLVAGDGLESKFAALEGGNVDDELAALKRGVLAGSKQPVAALPEGKPIRDAIDLELEELRKKAKE